jgi:hypothetical protein
VILRQKWQRQSHREVASKLAIGARAVGTVLARATKTGLSDWARVEDHARPTLFVTRYDPQTGLVHPQPQILAPLQLGAPSICLAGSGTAATRQVPVPVAIRVGALRKGCSRQRKKATSTGLWAFVSP